MTTALYTGSFDPVHLGHVRVIEQAARSFEAVVVAVLGNPAKTSGLLPVAERVRLLEAATAGLDNVTCTAHHGLAVDAAREHGASTLVRSAHKEHRTELEMAAHNERLTGIPTTFISGDPDLTWVSSTVVRRLLADGDADRLRAVVPSAVADALLSP